MSKIKNKKRPISKNRRRQSRAKINQGKITKPDLLVVTAYGYFPNSTVINQGKSK